MKIIRLKSNKNFFEQKNYLLKKIILSHLKKINIPKLYKIILLYCYTFFKKIFFFKKLRCLYYVNLKEYSKSAQLPIIKIFDKVAVNFSLPKVYSMKKTHGPSSTHANYMFPEVYVSELTNATLNSTTNVVIVGDTAILQDLYNPIDDYMFEEISFRYSINAKKNLISFLDTYNALGSLDSAATFLDSTSFNYAHWITEVLPRIAIFCRLKQFKNVPLIVDDNLHPNIMDSLSQIVDKDRKVYVLENKSKINVKKLHVVSVTGYIPVEQKKIFSDNHGVFSPHALNLLRNRLFSIIKSLPPKDYPKKIFLKRNSLHRKLINEKEITQIIINKGYAVIELEKITFLQQVSMIKNANCIIGVSGAALANLIFASSDAEINILVGATKNSTHIYWQNIAKAVNLKVNFIFGEINNLDKGVHSDFSINPKLIK